MRDGDPTANPLEAWVAELLVDPIGKEPLAISSNGAASNYGKAYPCVNGVLDLRPFRFLHFSADAQVWAHGQDEYEKWSDDLAFTDATNYEAEREGVREVYVRFPIIGRCLDVGGHQGRLRAFLSPGQEYVILDPYLRVFRGIDKQPRLVEAYPFLKDPVNFICGMAEYLPFRSNSFDTVHMRSVLDHFQNPELALWEAYRVLRDKGQLIVGLYVEGGMNGRLNAKEYVKHVASHILPMLGINKFVDHHVWHPTFPDLCKLIESIGFEIDHVHWQSQWKDRVCYIRAIKSVSKNV